MSTEIAPQIKNRLDEAISRAHSAVDMLEQSVNVQTVEQGHQERNEQHLQLVVGENESLKEEQSQLNEAIDMLQGQYDDLQKVATNIYGKLDDSVRRITKIIGN